MLFVALITGIALTVGIAASSFWLSFAALRELAVMAGTDPTLAWALPAVLDGAIVATTVIALALSHHNDPQTVRGRRLVLAVLIVAASISILGNGYHATLTTHAVPPLVAAGIATVAPVFLLAMTEVLAVVLRAPHQQETRLSEAEIERTQPNALDAAESTSEQESGGLEPAIWATVLVYLQYPDWAYNDVASELGVDTATVSTHLAAWFDLQMTTAQRCGNRETTTVDRPHKLEKRERIPALA
ncbi:MULTISPECIES: DUF2637 domain-containing protein [unclassified Rhodococcus (in: high G+C Gram-positive bacteria)]|uniref:DUF2637 domain-containing protein n=1 Tax=unclassified Rhodococcus (in: high G+C Gram-positive bacteria) TaxID=192944 RepID=UPI0027E091A4|nr:MULTISPECIES: DUF2637 domain-containing protein [unclassified Rhodococcus (in: high G+C Gram-positive bacteria)]